MKKHIALLLALTAVLLTPTALKPQAWEKIPGKLDYISVGNKDTIWGVLNKKAHRWDKLSRKFIIMPGVGKKNKIDHISVAKDGTVWGIHKKIVVQWSNKRKYWFPVAVGSTADKVFAINKDLAYGLIGGRIKQFKIGKAPDPINLPCTISVKVLVDPMSGWTSKKLKTIYPKSRDIDFLLEPEHVMFMIMKAPPAGKRNKMLFKTVFDPHGYWERIYAGRAYLDEKVKDVSCGVGPSGDLVWAITLQDEILLNKKKIPGRLKQISAAKDGSGESWGVNKKGEIYRYTKFIAATTKKALVGAETYRNEALKALKDVTSKFGPNLSPEAKNKISNYRENVMYKWMRYIGTWNIQQKRKIIEDLKQLAATIKADTQEMARETKEALEEAEPAK